MLGDPMHDQHSPLSGRTGGADKMERGSIKPFEDFVLQGIVHKAVLFYEKS